MPKTDKQKALECLQVAIVSYPEQRVGQIIANVFNLHAPELFYIDDRDFCREVIEWTRDHPSSTSKRSGSGSSASGGHKGGGKVR